MYVDFYFCYIKVPKQNLISKPLLLDLLLKKRNIDLNLCHPLNGLSYINKNRTKIA